MNKAKLCTMIEKDKQDGSSEFDFDQMIILAKNITDNSIECEASCDGTGTQGCGCD